MSSIVILRPITSTRNTARLSSRRIAGGRDKASLIRSTETGNSPAGSGVASGSGAFWGAGCAADAGAAGIGPDCRGIAKALVARSNDKKRVIGAFMGFDDDTGVSAAAKSPAASPGALAVLSDLQYRCRPAVPPWDGAVRNRTGPVLALNLKYVVFLTISRIRRLCRAGHIIRDHRV